MKHIRLLTLFFVLVGLSFTSCKDNKANTEGEDVMLEQDRYPDTTNRDENPVYAVMRKEPRLSSFYKTVNSAKLEDAFQRKEGDFTIFAPSNDAFDRLSDEERDAMMVNTDYESAGARVYYLAVNQKLEMNNIEKKIKEGNGMYTVPSMQGELITLSMAGDTIVLADNLGNMASIIDSVPGASNGKIYIINGILKPMDGEKKEQIKDSIPNVEKQK